MPVSSDRSVCDFVCREIPPEWAEVFLAWETARSRIPVSHSIRQSLWTKKHQQVGDETDSAKNEVEKHLMVYSLRHALATHLLQHDVDVSYIAKLLGHRSLNTTQQYLKIEIGDLKRVHSLYHPRERWSRGCACFIGFFCCSYITGNGSWFAMKCRGFASLHLGERLTMICRNRFSDLFLKQVPYLLRLYK